jgi:hypothetical protein
VALFFTNHEITVYRNRRIGVTNRYGMSATGTVLPSDITPASLERTKFENQSVGKTYLGYIEVNADVKEGDEIVVTDSSDQNAKRYSVKGVSRWEGFGIVDCKELTLVSMD